MSLPRSALGAILFSHALVVAAAPAIEVKQPSLVIDGESTTEVVARGEGARSLNALASAGHLTGREEKSADEVHWTFMPPARGAPQVALLVFWTDPTDAPPEVSTARVSLIGRTDLVVSTEPGARVEVRVGDHTFGPRKADAVGRVAVPIEVPPGVHEATVLGARKGKSSKVTVPIDVPAVNPLSGFLAPDPINTRKAAWLWLGSTQPVAPGGWRVDAGSAAASLTRFDNESALFRLSVPLESKTVRIRAALRGMPEASLELGGDAITPALPSPPTRPPTPAFTPGLSIGGFYAGGANVGPAVDVVLSYRWPTRPTLHLEGQIGYRSASLSTTVAGLGSLSSSVLALSIQAGARERILEGIAWSLDFHAAAGALVFNHQTMSAFQSAFSEAGVDPQLFLGVQGGYRFPWFELYLELGASYAVVRTPQLDAQLGGAVLALGARWTR